MEHNTYLDIKATKAYKLIRKGRFRLPLQQQKIMLYLVLQITPCDDDFKLYEFSILEFCKVCRLDYTSGKHYSDLKKAVRDIAEKNLRITLEDGRETLVKWIEEPCINKKDGVIKLKLNADMKPFLLHLRQSFTSHEIIYALHFRSKYTIRLYELMKSIHLDEREEYTHEYTIDELRRLLDAENYTQYKSFKRRVLETAVKEVCTYSHKDLSYQEIKRGAKVIAIEFSIKVKDAVECLKIREITEKELALISRYQPLD